MIFNTQIAKKVLATSATLAILGSTIATPINVLSAEAAEAIQTVAMTEGMELINKDTSLANKRFKNFTVTGEYINNPEPANGFELTGTDPNRYELSGQTHRMVAKNNPFDYYFHEVFLISATAGFTAVTIDTTVGRVYAFDYSYKLFNAHSSTSNADSVLTLEAGVSQFGGNRIDSNKYSMQGNKDGSTTGSATIEFKATSTKTVVYVRAGYTRLNTSGGQHYAGLTSYSVKAVKSEASIAVSKLFHNNNVKDIIVANLTQSDIDTTKRVVAAVTDTAEKAELTAQIAEAQAQLNATNAVKALFENDILTTPTTVKIKSTTTQGAIDNAKNLIAAMKQADYKVWFASYITEAQKQLDAKTAAEEQARQEAATKAVKELFNNNDVKGTIKDSTTPKEIDSAKNLVASVTDATKKKELENQIVEAQNQLNAKIAAAEEQARQEAATKAVKELFNNNDVKGTIKDSTTQKEIDSAKSLVASVTDATKKKELENQIAEAQKQLDAKTTAATAEEVAKKAIEALFNNNNTDAAIKTTTNQDAINEAQLLVYKVTDTSKKAALQLLLNRASYQLNARQAIASLFENGNVNGKIKVGTDRATVDAVQILVDKVTSSLGKTPLQTDLDKAKAQVTALEASQAEEAATKAVKGLFNNDDVTGTIKGSTTQSAIDSAKNLVSAVTDATKKKALENQIAEAQKQLNAKLAAEEQARQEAAKKAVEALFNNNDVTGTIKDNTTQQAINNAKNLVSAVTDATKKKALEAQIAEAQKQLDTKTAGAAEEQARQEAAKKAVEALFNNNDVTGTIKEGTTQQEIDSAKNLVSAVTDATKKTALENQIAEAQKQLTAKSELTGEVNTFTLQKDRYLTGTYSGTGISAMSVDVNGVRHYGGTVKDGTFSFYALDKIASAGDVVIVNLHGADKTIKKSFTVTIIAPTKITQNAYKVKDSNITGTFDNPEITKMNITVNGTTYWGGTLANGEFKFYALDKIANATDVVSMNFYNAKNELITSKNLSITVPVVTAGEITSATLAVGDKNIVGTITGDIKSFGVTIDGTTYSGGTIAADGTFKFYVADKKFTADSEITIIGYDKSKNALSEMILPVSK
ncbi:toxin Cry1Ac domain D-VI-related protein [Listeria newyorkensis]|uniref:Uncharacterized protein n=1 Tax=Listeria newyorkensis TaxID=1497681 RepID=A0A841YX77_9LIST|nr:toxin Cry1Ac domain D-VI-related protein [Listeria newyorkensis]MBC1457176.1 hypothetical protein [Listeria newyorkensis]